VTPLRIVPSALRLYVVTGTVVGGRPHEDIARAAAAGGATAVQLRAPELDDERLFAVAAELARLCTLAGVRFVVNNRIDVAVAVGSGVHLGQSDGIESARAHLGDRLVLGVSVDDPEQARAAEAAGADYLAITVRPSATKPEARPHGVDGLRAVVDMTGLPVVGIGGLHAGNVAEVFQTGASGVAVVSAVAAADDPLAAVRELRAAVDESTRARR
jgi:thiamine-phosphate pyrophosphorylase